jgi:hypothetical protein
LDAPLNVFDSVVTLPTFHALRSEFIAVLTKVFSRVVTEAVFHEAKPVPTNLDAPKNVQYSVVTLVTFHALRSEFISFAS